MRCNGTYSYRIVDPILFYKNVTGNVSEAYYRSEIDQQLKSELVYHLAPAFAIISEMQVRPNELMGKGPEIANALRQELSKTWTELRGLEVVSLALNSVSIPEGDEELIKQAQRAGMLRDPNLAAATIAAAQSDALRTAAANEGGAMTGFLGMGMAGMAGGLNSADLFRLGQEQAAAQQAAAATSQQSANNAAKASTEADLQSMGGTAWQCSCGAYNQSKFCSECGRKAPSTPIYRCDKCGYEPPAAQAPKFCPECGDKFDENDLIH